VYKSSNILSSSGVIDDAAFAVVVDLEKLPAFIDKYLEVGPEQVALMRGTSPNWIYLEQGPRRLELDKANYISHLAVLSTLSQTLELTIGNLFSKDPIPAIVTCTA
jgi:hypothetical protein